jgi:hypothetical protein
MDTRLTFIAYAVNIGVISGGCTTLRFHTLVMVGLKVLGIGGAAGGKMLTLILKHTLLEPHILAPLDQHSRVLSV